MKSLSQRRVVGHDNKALNFTCLHVHEEVGQEHEAQHYGRRHQRGDGKGLGSDTLEVFAPRNERDSSQRLVHSDSLI